jgi:hypothetical protein
MPAPRFATARDPGRRSVGPAVAKIAQLRNRPLMPWQQYVADVGGEVDDRGFFVYPLIVVLVQRQAGKTDLDLCQSTQRCLMGPNRRVWHTAQTGQDAAEKWDEHVDDIVAPDSPLRGFVKGKPLRSNGKQSLTFVNGSKLRPHPPTRESLHGKQSDTNNVDEGWAFDDVRGGELMQAITPTQTTRFLPPYNGAQTWVWSAAGDAASTWLRALVNRGRSGDPDMAYFEFGIPDDADPLDLDVIAAHHPAFGHTVTMDALRSAKTQMINDPKQGPGAFARGYGNRWTGAGERVIGIDAWRRASTTAKLPAAGRPTFGVASNRDGSLTAVVACVVDDAGRPWLEVIAHRPGRSWAAGYLRDRLAKWPGASVAVLRNSPAGPIADALELAGVPVIAPTQVEYAAACSDFYDRVVIDPVTEPEPRLIIRSHEALDGAADVAGRRLGEEGQWVWSNARSTGDISALSAGTLAAWLALRAPAPAPAPVAIFA